LFLEYEVGWYGTFPRAKGKIIYSRQRGTGINKANAAIKRYWACQGYIFF
jgi:hypothetical protein